MFKLKDIKTNNGATLDKQGNTINYKRGYQVSKRDLAIIPTYKLRKSQLIEMLAEVPEGANLGIWIDNGKAYIDQSVKVNDKAIALRVGRALKQLAVWDWKAGKAIAC